MRRIVVTEFVSLDGVMEAPGGEPGYKHSGWVARHSGMDWFPYKNDELFAHDALLYGRKTYDGMAAAWPTREGDYADRMNALPKYVASTTLTDPEWNNTTVLQGDTAEAVRQLKAQEGGDILIFGSNTLVQYLREHDLVDEYRLMIFPVVLGSGMRLFENSEDAKGLKLIDSRRFDSGVMVLAYEVDKTPTA
ncbi:MAG: dihydrofolate reductase family protein [Armatimonas sp.]